MFRVEWIQNGKAIRSESMLGANLSDILKVAVAKVPAIMTQLGNSPDCVRVQDFSRGGKVTVHKLRASDAKKL
jgi:hypothetical protein